MTVLKIVKRIVPGGFYSCDFFLDVDERDYCGCIISPVSLLFRLISGSITLMLSENNLGCYFAEKGYHAINLPTDSGVFCRN